MYILFKCLSLCLVNRAQQELDSLNGEHCDPFLMDELQALRYHKSDLEIKLDELQDSRRHLMGQLEGLMKVLKASETPSSCGSLRIPLRKLIYKAIIIWEEKNVK